jgi:hypothetical protein
MSVSLEIQYPLLLKIITFDKEFHNKFENKVVIGILYQENFRTSEEMKNELVKIIKERNYSVEGKKVEYVLLDISNNNDIYGIINNSNINIIYVLTLKGVNVEDITRVTKKEKILTYAAMPQYVQKGIAVGIDTKGGKPLIVINLKSAKQEGAEFTSQLLKLSEIITN